MLERVITPRRRDLGGFEVARVLPVAERRMVGPFIFFDHMGPVDMPPNIPRSADVRPHPHIGLSTVTYLFEGEMTHRDSTGVEQVIRPGEVNWMVAGGGVTHSERFDGLRATGGEMHGIQAWVALPEGEEEASASFAHHEGADLPSYSAHGITARLIAGSAFGAKSAVKTHSPMFYVHTQLSAGAATSVPSGYPERAVYIVSGTVELGGQSYAAGQMLVLLPEAHPVVTATSPSVLMMIGGEPLGVRHIWWNFVASRKERIEQAKADWQAGRFRLPPNDNQEFIPLPPEPKPPEPMS
jgi:redox-sensitive bicupin YhaK (pirin superfamily)